MTKEKIKRENVDGIDPDSWDGDETPVNNKETNKTEETDNFNESDEETSDSSKKRDHKKKLPETIEIALKSILESEIRRYSPLSNGKPRSAGMITFIKVLDKYFGFHLKYPYEPKSGTEKDGVDSE